MDPVTALGVAAGTVQFVSFASGLISKSVEIYSSAEGCSDDVLNIENVYSRLLDISSSLDDPHPASADPISFAHVVAPAKRVTSLKSLSKDCKKDCDKLLGIVEELRTSDRGKGHRWRSFRTALKTLWNEKEIASLEKNLSRSQRTLNLEISAISNEWHVAHNKSFKDLQMECQRLQVQQTQNLVGIEMMLDGLKSDIIAIKSNSVDISLASEIELIQERMTKLSVSERNLAREQAVIKSLSFESRPVRHNSITQAHEKTFRWVFEETETDEGGIDAVKLLRWLRQGHGIFWVSGKPGSGKSTFMKYVANDENTRTALSQWASTEKLVIVSHYFWSAGTDIQRSQQGLLQTLLYEIFRQCPDLIESVCEHRWLYPGLSLNEKWSLEELHTAIQTVAKKDDIPYKFCFFIDGLDEYDGDHFDICQQMKKLSEFPGIKLCLSSRAWNVFEDSFGGNDSKKLYMQDLTRGDIQRYVESRLSEHPRWNDISVSPSQAKWLLDEVTQRAFGVFLWVFLVTKLLHNGLTEYDSFSDLCKRLESFPTDLEVFFKHILETVDPFYHKKMSTTLQLAVVAACPLPTTIYSFHDQEYDDTDYALHMSTEHFSKEKVRSLQEQTDRRLNARCRGLLELNRDRSAVEFLHRTVSDFLRTREMADFLAAKAPIGHSSTMSLFKAYTAFMKSTDLAGMGPGEAPQEPEEILFRALEIAADLDEEDVSVRQPVHLLLEDLDPYISSMIRQHMASPSPQSPLRWPHEHMFREKLLRTQCANYLSNKLDREPLYFSEIREPPMLILLEQCLDVPKPLWRAWPSKSARLIRSLLENKEDPNKQFIYPKGRDVLDGGPKNPITPWTKFLSAIFFYDHDSEVHLSAMGRSALNLGLPSLFLKHGSNPNVLVFRKFSGGKFHYNIAWMDYLLASFSFDWGSDMDLEAKYLRTLDDFLEHAVDVEAIPKDVRRSANHALAGKSSVSETFCKYLKLLEGSSPARYNVRLIAGVTERFLSRARDQSWRTEPIWEAIDTVFSADIASDLRDKLEGTRGGAKKRGFNIGVRKQVVRERKIPRAARRRAPSSGEDITDYEADNE